MSTDAGQAALPPPGLVERDTTTTASIRRDQRRVASRIFGVLALLTLLVAAANAWLLYRAVPEPYTVSFEGSYRPAAAEAFSLAVAWDPLPGAAEGGVVRPVLFLDEEQSPVPRLSEARPRAFDVSRSHTLRIVVPGDATPITHRGRLVLRPLNDRPGSPTESVQTIAIEVIGGFWSSWFLLRNWLFVVAGALALLWAFCLLVFPSPCGAIRFEQRWEEGARPREVRLSAGLRSWLIPFDRSTVTLQSVFARHSLRKGDGPTGDVLFVFSGMPPVLFLESGTTSGLQKAFYDGTVPEEAAFEPCGLRETMGANRLFRYGGGRGGAPTFFRYLSPRALVTRIDD